MCSSDLPINWEEVDGSKVQIVDASLTMGRDLCVIRGCYTLGLWGIADPHKTLKAFVPADYDTISATMKIQ
mgnify:CR=1 FL=1